MPDPIDLADLSPDVLLDAHAISGADGASVPAAGGMTVLAGYEAPTLSLDALAGKKALRFTGENILTFDPPEAGGGFPSGGNYPEGLTVFAVIRFDELANLDAPFPFDRRVWLSFFADGVGVNTQAAVYGLTRKIDVQFYKNGSGVTWGQTPDGEGAIDTDRWYVLSFRTDGETLTVWRAAAVDKVAVNPDYGSGLTQYIQRLNLGGQPTRTDSRPFVGDVAYFGAVGRALTDEEHAGVIQFLAERYELPTREVGFEAFTGTTGEDLFLRLFDTTSLKPAHYTAQTGLVSGGFTYRVNGGAPQNPTAAYYRHPDSGERTPVISFPLASPILPGQTVTVSLLEGALRTTSGLCEPFTGEAAANNVGAASILPQEVGTTPTMALGWNANFQGAYYVTFGMYKNLFKTSAKVPDGQLNFDANGNLVNGIAGTTYVVRSASQNGELIGYYPGANYGRYVVKWNGPAGSLLKLAVADEATPQTLITHVEGLDELDGTAKKRYFDITPINGAPRQAPVFNLVWETGPYTCTDIEVMESRHEGSSEKIAPEFTDRMRGYEIVRSMDLVQTNFANIGSPADFKPVTEATYLASKVRRAPILSIVPYGGPYYSPTAPTQFWRITFDGPHGLTSGQRFTIRSAGNVPMPALRDDSSPFAIAGVPVDFNGHLALGWSISETEFIYSQYTNNAHVQSGVAGWSGEGAEAEIDVFAGAPLEALTWIVNEADVPVLHYTSPHSCSPAAVAHSATVLAANLGAGRKLRIELSNETWNLAFLQWSFFRDETQRRGLNPGGQQSPNLGYAACTVEFFDAFKAAWVAAGRLESDLEYVINVQYALPPSTQEIAGWLAANAPEYEYIWSFAPYFYQHAAGRLDGVDYDSWTLARIMDYMEAWAASWDSGEYISSHKAFLDEAGLNYRLSAYEFQDAYKGMNKPDPDPIGWDYQGGANPVPKEVTWEKWNRQALAVYLHPRMYGIAMAQMRALDRAGLEDAAIYGFNNNSAYEGPHLGLSYYGDMMGIGVTPGRGDGQGSATDNVPLITDVAGRPAWPPTFKMDSPRLAARDDWQEAVNGAAPDTFTGSFASLASPRTTPVGSVGLTFSEPVTGATVAALALTRNGSAVGLSGVTLTGAGASYTVAGLTSATTAPGTYVLTFRKDVEGSPSTATTLKTLAADVVRSWQTNEVVDPPPAGPASIFAGIRFCRLLS